MKTKVRVLGTYQIIAGVFSLVTLYPIISARGIFADLLLLAVAALSIVAGALLWEGRELGWRLTIVNQATQAIGVQLPFSRSRSYDSLQQSPRPPAQSNQPSRSPYSA
jgi:hypothetical protein